MLATRAAGCSRHPFQLRLNLSVGFVLRRVNAVTKVHPTASCEIPRPVIYLRIRMNDFEVP